MRELRTDHVDLGLFIEWPGGVLEALPAGDPRASLVTVKALYEPTPYPGARVAITGTVQRLGRSYVGGFVNDDGTTDYWDDGADKCPLPTTRYSRRVGGRLIPIGNEWPGRVA